MVDVFLIITAAVLAAIVFGLVMVLLVNFVHPDDVNQALVPKVVCVFALWLAFCSVLVLPFDVANQRGEGGDLRVDVLWQIIYITDAVLLALVVPYAFFFYESDVDAADSKARCCAKQGCMALQWTLGFFITFTLILLILFFTLADAEVPVTRVARDRSQLVAPGAPLLDSACTAANACSSADFTWVIPVSFTVYTMAFLSFVGWFFFTLFVGVGLISLPMDLINEWRTRPEPMSFQEYSEKKKELGRRAAYLLQAGLTLAKERAVPGDSRPRKQRKSQEKTMLKFEQAYYLLKRDYEVLRISHELKGGNPLWYAMKLALGVAGAIVSLTWIIHIGVFMLPEEPVHPFLNQFFIELEEVGGGGFPLFGVVAFGIYAFYLMWCVVMGNFKIGMRLLWFKIYPMEINGTMMNAFLANSWILLLCSLTTVQFCVRAFPVYARLTSADLLMGTQAQYLKFFRYFWENNVFILAMLCVSGLTLVTLVLCPKDRAAEIERRIDDVENDDDD